MVILENLVILVDLGNLVILVILENLVVLGNLGLFFDELCELCELCNFATLQVLVEKMALSVFS